MSDAQPSFFARIVLAWTAYFRILFNAQFARRVATLNAVPALPSEAEAKETKSVEPAPTPKPVVLREASPDAACQLLSLLQREGRFVDFVQEEIDGVDDADVGAAARVVHAGCRKALAQYVEVESIREEEEGDKVTLEAGFDSRSVRLTGNVVGEPPFTGTLSHRGWRAKKVTLPQMAEEHDAKVLAPAEVEL